MTKFLKVVLGTACMCCAQLMPAQTSKPMTAEDSLKVLKIHAPVDYSIPVDPSVRDEKNVTEPRYHSIHKKKSGNGVLNAVKTAATWTGFLAGSVATGTISLMTVHMSSAMYRLSEIVAEKVVDGVVYAVTGENPEEE